MKPKFRAWDKISKKIFPVTTIDFDQSYVMIEEINGLLGKRDFDEIEIMQSTGLFDKNGKEIYEDDIVRITLTDGFRYVVGEDGAVKYKLGAFYILNGLDEYLISDFHIDDIEVVGNINEWLLGAAGKAD